MSEEAIRVFYSYSRKDQALREKLDQHLAPLKFAGLISTWYDLLLDPGSDWKQNIGNRLDTADIILLLVSENFLSSEYCYSIELTHALEREARKEACVIPVILEPCDWKHELIPFSRLTALPNHEKAITEWDNQNAAFTTVVQSIRLKVQTLVQQRQAEQEKQRYEQELREQAEQERVQREQQQQQTLRLKQTVAMLAAQRLQLAQATATNDLASEKGVDYTRLRDLLKAGLWKEADGETAERMFEVMGRQMQGRLSLEDIQNFPCTDLRTIDRLWMKCSNGRFGFSVQKKIWQQCGRPREYSFGWEEFGKAVGWRSRSGLSNYEWLAYIELTFDTSAPIGHLPGRIARTDWMRPMGSNIPLNMQRAYGGSELLTQGVDVLVFLFSRVEACKL